MSGQVFGDACVGCHGYSFVLCSAVVLCCVGLGGARCSPDLCWAVEGFMCLFFPEFWGFCGLLTDGMVFCGMISYLYQM